MCEGTLKKTYEGPPGYRELPVPAPGAPVMGRARGVGAGKYVIPYRTTWFTKLCWNDFTSLLHDRKGSQNFW